MAVCPNCGEDNPAKARFCMFCATPLDQVPLLQAEERKVVSVLFVDLVGFTARSHDADPEDVRAALAPYHRRLKRAIEGFGGTVEKFIGDAVMAVFGAPVAHEDDTERAVRAALRITEAIGELNESNPNLDLSIRAAVNTGEGLVNVSARPQAGEGMVTGDVVNTASRLQSVAPTGGVVVGEITYHATNDTIVYEEMQPVAVKGKPEPVPVWRAVSARSRFGVDAETRYRTPFIGREADLDLLKATFQRTLRDSSLQLVTIVGEPGVGKSRLVAEFARYVDERPELVTWRQGRSIPYGAGITFWALGEIVKAQAGINESDSPQAAADKVAAAVNQLMDDEADRPWLQARLAPLVGATPVGGTAEKEESFTAWLRFLEGIAAKHPVVVVFEDLHWADASLLEFMDYVVAWSSGVPIMIVGTARPELFDKHSNWAGGSRNATTISLPSLSDSEIAQLISNLLAQAVLPAEINAALLDRADGNPLYAEEFIRMLRDQGVLEPRGGTVTFDTEADMPMPVNVHSVIAARLDTLSADRKSVLHNAAVVGKVFWCGAVAALGAVDPALVKESLHELALKELVRRSRISSVEGEEEYSFWHSVVRDVSYSQIPRVERGRKHRLMGEWIESIAGERIGDHAEMLAHHYLQALEGARVAHDHHAVEELSGRTGRFLVLAGERALYLDAVKAHRYYERALELQPDSHTERASILERAGYSAMLGGRIAEASRYLQDAIKQARVNGNLLTQGLALTRLSTVMWWEGNTARSHQEVEEAIRLLEGAPIGPELGEAYSQGSSDALLSGRPEYAMELSSKTLRVAQLTGSEAVMVTALRVRGAARCELGDVEGLDDLRVAVESGTKAGLSAETALVYGYFADATWRIERASSAERIYRDSLAYCERRGLVADLMFAKAEFLLRALFDLGRWNEIDSSIDELLRWSQRHNQQQTEAYALLSCGQVCVWRGQVEEAASLQGRIIALAGSIRDLQILVPALALGALIEQMRGNSAAAMDLLSELGRVTDDRPPWRARYLPTAVRTFVTAGATPAADDFVSGIEVTASRDVNCVLTSQAILAEAKSNTEEARNLYQEAAQRWAHYGFVLEEGQAHLGLARCLIALGNAEQATEPLRSARTIFTRLDARPLVDEVDHHLGETTAVSS